MTTDSLRHLTSVGIRSGRFPLWMLWLLAGGLVILAGMFQNRFSLAIVWGNSMNPSFRNGQVLIVDKRAYQSGIPARGDVVVARCGREWVVKRVVGLPGELVEIRRSRLFVNETEVMEAYLPQPGMLDVGEGRLGEASFGITGDNRATMTSTATLVVSQTEIVGRVVDTLGQRLRRLATGAFRRRRSER